MLYNMLYNMLICYDNSSSMSKATNCKTNPDERLIHNKTESVLSETQNDIKGRWKDPFQMQLNRP